MTSRRPPSQRNPEYVNQRQSRQIQSFIPGALTGRLASAGPITKLPGPPDALFGFDGGNAAQATLLFYNDDIYDLTSDGAQDLTLTFVPDPESLHVALNGFHARKGVDWTVSSNILSLLTPLDPRTDDVVTTEYVYLAEQADPIADGATLNVPFQSDGWRYHGVTTAGGHPPELDTSTDDSTWATGSCVMGWGSYSDLDGHAKATELPHVNTGELGHVYDGVFRRRLPAGTGITITYDGGPNVGVYVDGVSVGGHNTGTTVKASISLPDQSASWLLAVYLITGGPDGGCDIEVTGTEL